MSALKWPLALSPTGTSPAILVARSDVSNDWMARMPDSAAIRRRQLVSTPSPSGVTMPMPVTTTRLIVRLPCRGTRRRSGLGVALDEADGVAHGLDLLGGVVRNLDAEFLLERHHQLDRIETVGAEIVDEFGILFHLRRFDAQMLDDDLLNALANIAHFLVLPVVSRCSRVARGAGDLGSYT